MIASIPLDSVLSSVCLYQTFDSLHYLVIDFETTNIDKGDSRNPNNEIISCSWDVYEEGRLVASNYCLYDGLLSSSLETDLYTVDFCIAHNAKFEIGWIWRLLGRELTTPFFCTQIAEYVLAGNRKWKLSLDAVADKRIGEKKNQLVSRLIKNGVCPSTIPLPFLEKYCRQDVALTHTIFLQQKEELKELNLIKVHWSRCIVTPALVAIERVGMKLDKERVIQENRIYEEKFNKIERELAEYSGGINLNSPKQVAELLYDRLGFSELKDRRGAPIRTATDGRKTDITTITSLKAGNKRQRDFIKLYKERSKVEAALSKTLRFFRAVVEETDDCIFYGNLNQTVTQTHRLSSTGKPAAFKLFDGKKKGIQLQNSPREFKPCYNSRYSGWKMGEIDGSQLEFRVAAFLGQDIRAIRDIVGGVDVHATTSAVLTEAGESTSRQEAKSRTFKPLYGGTSGTKAEQTYFSHFREKYEGITSEQERWKSEVEKTKQLVTITGLRFYWPDTKWESNGRYLKNTTSICNFPVQSFATADIIPIAVTIVWRLLRKLDLKSFIINTIHDSIVMEIHPDEVEIVKEIGRLSFVEGVVEYLYQVYGFQFNVPLDVECKIGSHWGEVDDGQSEASVLSAAVL